MNRPTEPTTRANRTGRRSGRLRGWLVSLALLAAGSIILVRADWFAPKADTGTADVSAQPPVRIKPEPVSFLMTDWDHGVVRYPDKVLVTEDGGMRWRELGSGETEPAAAEKTGGSEAVVPGNWQIPVSVTLGAEQFPVKQGQFLTGNIGWVLVSNAPDLEPPLLVTTDGGNHWQAQVTPEVRTAVEQEKLRIRRTAEEAALYASAEGAKLAMDASWRLLPETASPGDVVLIRSAEPGDVVWQDKTYALQSFGAGYFAYLPIPKALKPGTYPVGGTKLTIKPKTFDTQYLTVTKEMESMKQDTQRIAADQKRIDQARSSSRPEFLGAASPFLKPIEGILTTPFGYTRYVNGKLDSSHMALDLAAKEGTPIQATNDGVVALADSLYLTGNSIYLDHGMGLFSQYAHLSKLNVKTGDIVKRGDIIGLVGTTGFSTGPHLHFTFWAHNVPVNPDLFFGTTPFHWQDKQP